MKNVLSHTAILSRVLGAEHYVCSLWNYSRIFSCAPPIPAHSFHNDNTPIGFEQCSSAIFFMGYSTQKVAAFITWHDAARIDKTQHKYKEKWRLIFSSFKFNCPNDPNTFTVMPLFSALLPSKLQQHDLFVIMYNVKIKHYPRTLKR